MEKVFRFTKAHWKKLVIASIPVTYGANYIKDEYQISRQMRLTCEAFNQYPISKNNKVLVVLNPVANKKRCEKMFKKYFEPVLHIAGYAVDVVRTTHVGHAKSLMEEQEQLPDIIVVAGGDGTSSEVVTGLTRRKGKVCPILFLPLGERNETALKLMSGKMEKESEIIKNMNQCMLALVKNQTQNGALIRYELVDDGHTEMNKPIYGIVGFSWGIMKDIEMNKDKYWYFSSLKHHVSALMASLSNKLHQNISAKIIYTPPCSGCKKCANVIEKKSRLNISTLLNPQLGVQPTHQMKEHELCSIEQRYNLLGKQVDITCNQNTESVVALKTDVIENITSEKDFLMNWMSKNKIQPTTSLESRTLEIIPNENNNQTFYMDGEAYDARHIKISFLPNALKYFALNNVMNKIQS